MGSCARSIPTFPTSCMSSVHCEISFLKLRSLWQTIRDWLTVTKFASRSRIPGRDLQSLTVCDTTNLNLSPDTSTSEHDQHLEKSWESRRPNESLGWQETRSWASVNQRWLSHPVPVFLMSHAPKVYEELAKVQTIGSGSSWIGQVWTSSLSCCSCRSVMDRAATSRPVAVLCLPIARWFLCRGATRGRQRSDASGAGPSW